MANPRLAGAPSGGGSPVAAQGPQGPWAWARCNSSTCDFGLAPTLTGLPSSGYWRPDLRTIRALRPRQLSSCYGPRGPWSRRPHEQSLPLAKYPGGCFATCVGSPGVVEADAGQHVAPPTPVLWSRLPAHGGQRGQQQVHAKVRPGVLPTKPLRHWDSICFSPSKYKNISGFLPSVPCHSLVPISENSACTQNFIKSNSSLSCFFSPSLEAHSFSPWKEKLIPISPLHYHSHSFLPCLWQTLLHLSWMCIYIYESH